MAAQDQKILQPLILVAALSFCLWSCASRKPNIDDWGERGIIQLGSQGKKSGLKKMSSEIERLLGSPYRSGGTTSQGLDCSGLVCIVYERCFGVKLPYSCEELYQIGRSTGKGDLSYGDLVFFVTSGRRVSHVGIYLSSGEFVHVSESSGTIVSSLREDYYRRRFKGGRRLLE